MLKIVKYMNLVIRPISYSNVKPARILYKINKLLKLIIYVTHIIKWTLEYVYSTVVIHIYYEHEHCLYLPPSDTTTARKNIPLYFAETNPISSVSCMTCDFGLMWYNPSSTNLTKACVIVLKKIAYWNTGEKLFHLATNIQLIARL